MHKAVRIFGLLLALSGLQGCGFLGDEPVNNQDLYTLESSCELNPDKLGEILNKDVSEQIKCIEDKFEKFRYIRLKDREILTQDELSVFISKVFSKNGQTIIDGIGLIFQLNMLLLRDSAGEMRRENIRPFFNMLINLNKEFVIINDAVAFLNQKDVSSEIFWEKRQELNQSLARIAKNVMEIISLNDKPEQNLDILNFFSGLKEKFPEVPIDEELVKSLLVLKKLFLGGNKFFISSAEVNRLLTILPELLEGVADAVFLEERFFSDKNALYNHLAKRMDSLESLIFQHPSNEVVFTTSELIEIVKTIDFSQGDKKIDHPEEIIKSFKKDLIGGHPEYYFRKDVKMFLSLIKGGLWIYHFNDMFKIDFAGIKNWNIEKIKNSKNLFNMHIYFLRNRISEIFPANDTWPKEIHYKNFIMTLVENTDFLNLSEDLLNSLIAVKPILVGGQKEILLADEIKDLVDNRYFRIFSLLFDTLFLTPKYLEKDIPRQETRDHLLGLIQLVKDASVNTPMSNSLFTTEDLKILAKEIISSERNRALAYSAIDNIHVNILGGKNGSFTFKNYLQILDVIDVAVGLFVEFNNIFELYEEYRSLDADKAIESRPKFTALASDFAKKASSLLSIKTFFPEKLMN